MKKKFISVMGIISLLMGLCTYKSFTGHSYESDLMLQNIEVLSRGEVTLVGCKHLDGATCYVFDGSGILVDSKKNQYPGN